MEKVKQRKYSMKFIERCLYDLEGLRKEIWELSQEIKYSRELDENVGGGRSGGRPSSPVEAMVIKTECNERLNELRNVLRCIELTFNDLPAPKQRVIYHRYMEKKPWESVCTKLGLHRQTCAKYRRQFLDEIMRRLEDDS